MENIRKIFQKSKSLENFLSLNPSGKIIGPNPFHQLTNWTEYYQISSQSPKEIEQTLEELLGENYSFKSKAK